MYGVSFGALATLSGFDLWQTCVLSLVMFTGGSQFALIGVVGAGGFASAPAAITSAALLGTRNTFYAIRMSPLIGSGFFRRALAAQVTIDESVAVSTAQPTRHTQRVGFWVTGVAIFVGWNLTTFLGALVGDVLGDVRAYGLDAAAAAAFLGLLWPRLKERQAIAVAVAAALVATLLTPVLPAGLPVVLTTVLAIAAGVFNLLGAKGQSATVQTSDPEHPEGAPL